MNRGNKSIIITYVNHKGISSVRNIKPVELYWGKTEYHKKEQWLLRAFCYDREAFRDFALTDIEGIHKSIR